MRALALQSWGRTNRKGRHNSKGAARIYCQRFAEDRKLERGKCLTSRTLLGKPEPLMPIKR